MTFIGIDPGKTGGLCLYSGGLPSFTPMPILPDGRVDAHQLRHLLDGHQTMTLVEQVNAFGMGRQSAFVFGANFGAICAVLDTLGVPWDTITPQKWQRIGPGNAPKGEQKARTVAWAMRRFPGVEWPTARAKREQIADAIGIAYAAYAMT
jgi:hypothetical protein